jgi:hypothetical protein
LGVRNTALLAITTPQDEENYFSGLMKMKDAHGEFVFHCVKLGLVCAACEKRNLACNHLLSLNPDWKPPERVAKVDLMSVRVRANFTAYLVEFQRVRACVRACVRESQLTFFFSFHF